MKIKAKILPTEFGEREEKLPQSYELYTIKIVKDINDKDVQIANPIERVTLEKLEAQKAEIQSKIDAINLIKG